MPVGPHPRPWPDDPRLDRDLLEQGDTRNVEDRYRYWSLEAIRADLATSRAPLHVAIENLAHDLNIGSVVRTANAYNVAGVHIVGRRRWNRRGAMVTDAYVDVHHHPDIASLLPWVRERGLSLVALENNVEAQPLETFPWPRLCMLLIGQEGSGLSDRAIAASDHTVAITQHGSTRSLNVAAAGAIAMFSWSLRHSRPHAGSAEAEAPSARG